MLHTLGSAWCLIVHGQQASKRKGLQVLHRGEEQKASEGGHSVHVNWMASLYDDASIESVTYAGANWLFACECALDGFLL